MARKIYKCNNNKCNNNEPITQFSFQEHVCSECGEILEIDKVASMRGIAVENVPGGYDSEVFNKQRTSRDGMLAEANYLSGESNSAY